MPLRGGDDEPLVTLNGLVHALYDRAGYDRRIASTEELPPPALSPDDVAWLADHLHAAGLR